MKAYRVHVNGRYLGTVEPKPHESLVQAVARQWPTASASPRLTLEPVKDSFERVGPAPAQLMKS